MSAIDKLTEKFRDFPGIGPRQAKRFVFFLLSRNPQYISELGELIANIKSEIRICDSCRKFFNGKNISKLCTLCSNQNRDYRKLLIVEKDVDLENIERSGAYDGQYFVLGGLIKILETEPEKKVRLHDLVNRVKNGLNSIKPMELILAFSLNAEGEHTAEFVENYLKNIFGDELTYSHLGRGVSVGAELEYLDSDTLKNALKNRY